MNDDDAALLRELEKIATLSDEAVEAMGDTLMLFQYAAEEFLSLNGQLGAIGYLALFAIMAAFKHPEWAAAHVQRFGPFEGFTDEAIDRFVAETPIRGTTS